VRTRCRTPHIRSVGLDKSQVMYTEEERGGLAALAASTGKNQAQLIREAVDHFIELASGSRRESILNNAAGMWQDRDDLPDFRATRGTWDRS